jgi:L-lactate dehydrogenase (cytochrome)
MSLDLRYPALSDLRAASRRRLPRFVWDYLDSATGTESVPARNRAALEAVRFLPAVLEGEFTPDLATDLLGRRFAVPFGIAPVGMSGLVWPGAEATLARTAATVGMPYCLSTVATRRPEEIGPHTGGCGWFQLYPPRDPGIRQDILSRARAAGFGVLVLTLDLPGPSRRERQLRARLTIPPRLTSGMLAQIALRPAWAAAMAREVLRDGRPRLRLMEEYLRTDCPTGSTAHAGYRLRTNPDRAYLEAVRAEWSGPLVVKGIMDPGAAQTALALGADGIWVSNHGGRQFDGAPAGLDVLPGIRGALGPEVPILYDGGVEGGLDILRALARGADFAMLGRGWHHALGALGPAGPAHLAEVLRADLVANMLQMGLHRPAEAAGRLWR